MARLESLPADQKAVLQLLLKQRKSYDELSNLLRITPDAVRERALNALDALGPQDTGGLSPEDQDDISDYLLGQQSASGRAAARELLERSGAGRAWARTVSSEMRTLSDDLPEIPSEARETDEAFDALTARRAARVEQARKSRVGGIVLLVGAGLALALVVLLLTGAIGGDDDDNGSTARTTPTSTTGPQVEAQINLRAATDGSKALGVANIVSQEGTRAIALIGQDLQKSSRYAVWLYSSPSKAQFLGFAPPVGDDGRLQGLAELPANAGDFTELVVTRERVDRPTRPGTLVLRGPLSGGQGGG